MTSTPARLQSDRSISKASSSSAIAPNGIVPAPLVTSANGSIAINLLAIAPCPPALPRQLSTPQWLNLGLCAVAGSLALALGLGLSAVQNQRTALAFFAQDTVPSILTTLRIQDSLAGLDASVANELLLPPDQNLEARQEADERQKKLTNYSLQVAHNLSYGNAEIRPITSLQLGLGDYLMAIERARVWHSQGKTVETILAYQVSAKMLDQQLLPAARALGQVKVEQLARAERRQQARIEFSCLGLALSGTGLLGYLIAVQLFLRQRTRRTLNPALLSATILAFGVGWSVLEALETSAAQLTQARTESFEALIALRTMRTLAYSAHADVSRALMEPGITLEYDTALREKLRQIVRFPSAQSPSIPPSGLLISVAKTLPDPAEQRLVQATIQALKTYAEQYERINKLDQQRQISKAIALTTGYQSQQLNGSFELFREAHHKLIELKLAEFDQSIGAASQTLDPLRWKLSIASAGILGLTIFGIQQRLREYRL